MSNEEVMRWLSCALRAANPGLWEEPTEDKEATAVIESALDDSELLKWLANNRCKLERMMDEWKVEDYLGFRLTFKWYPTYQEAIRAAIEQTKSP
jgi:hypothetical protein